MRYLALNLKAYNESTGEAGAKLLDACIKMAPYAQARGVSLVLAPHTTDVALYARLSDGTGVKIFGQGVDAVDAGAKTGHVPPESLKHAGAVGSLLNHSENRVSDDAMKFAVPRLHALGLQTCVCAADVPEGVRLASLLSPTMVAVEPPELIGGDISVSTAKPEVVADAVARIKKVAKPPVVLVGAGVKTPQDVAKSVELGAEGVLLASGYVKAKDPQAFIQGMVDAMAERK
jgi:triosephosphate isomerase